MHSQNRSGTAAVEMAVAIPLLILLFAITVDFARIFSMDQILVAAVRNAALFAAQEDLSDRTSFETATEFFHASTEHIRPSPAVEIRKVKEKGETYIEVQATYRFRLIAPYWIQREWLVTRSAKTRSFQMNPSEP